MSYIQAALDIVREELGVRDDDLLRLYTVLALTSGEHTTPAQVHDAWAVWKHRTDPGRRSIVPFGDLPPHVQALDAPYTEGIRRAARRINPGRSSEATAGAVEIMSFGYLHGGPPPAHLVWDLREHFRDPQTSVRLRHLTAEDVSVREAVLATAGVQQLVDAAAGAVMAYMQGSAATPVSVAFGCAGGRHRAAVAAIALAYSLHVQGVAATVVHRDLHKPVVGSPTSPNLVG